MNVHTISHNHSQSTAPAPGVPGALHNLPNTADVLPSHLPNLIHIVLVANNHAGKGILKTLVLEELTTTVSIAIRCKKKLSTFLKK